MGLPETQILIPWNLMESLVFFSFYFMHFLIKLITFWLCFHIFVLVLEDETSRRQKLIFFLVFLG